MTLFEIVNFLGAAVALWFSMKKGKPIQPAPGGGASIVDILDQVRKFVDGLNVSHDQKAQLAKGLLASLTVNTSAGYPTQAGPPPFVPSGPISGP